MDEQMAGRKQIQANKNVLPCTFKTESKGSNETIEKRNINLCRTNNRTKQPQLCPKQNERDIAWMQILRRRRWNVPTHFERMPSIQTKMMRYSPRWSYRPTGLENTRHREICQPHINTNCPKFWPTSPLNKLIKHTCTHMVCAPRSESGTGARGWKIRATGPCSLDH